MLHMTHTVQEQGTHYFRLALRWILPIVAILLVATVLAISPLLATHAAGTHTATPAAPTHTTSPSGPSPDILRRGF